MRPTTLVQRKLEFQVRKSKPNAKNVSSKKKDSVSSSITRSRASVTRSHASLESIPGHSDKSANKIISPMKKSDKVKSPKVSDENLYSPPKPKVTPLNSARPCLSPIKRNIWGDETPYSKIPAKSPKIVSENYSKTKQLLHTAHPAKVICREEEQSRINTFLSKHISSRTGSSMYISGAPGTGKTVVLTEIIKHLKVNNSCKVVYLNCMIFHDVWDIYKKIYTELTGEIYSKSTSKLLKSLQKIITSSKKSIVLVLDEIDQLDNKHHEVLYELFGWPALSNSSFVLIGVANSLDLTDRILPRLQARLDLRPTLMNFPPYTRDQIVQVIEDRLKVLKLNCGYVFEPSAIQFCARKVASMAGDMRKALDICRRAIEQMETEMRFQQISSAGSKTTNGKTECSKKITISHISKIMTEVYGLPIVNSTEEMSSVPIQQKIAICSIFLMVKHGKGAKEVELGNLHDVFKKVCHQCNVTAVGQSEFVCISSLLESQGIIQTKKAKDLRKTKISLRLSEQDLQWSFKDKTLLSSIMERSLP
ncbi:cell division control protein 6 homolog [Octopus sinensis]|uniref:Cell division control protein n=1 Tax=Octopus sinensis TaxID=2607531 RepID=A0A6P7UC01_9MOLL|nr:cell division control protein 6 homolog [Octopus sinensis]